MAGHSKWSSIKHKKAIADAKKGKDFTRASSAIIIAAKKGIDPEKNSALALAIEKAKKINMPKINIEKAIKKGSGSLGGEGFENILYEGYGPKGVAFLIEVATDNRKRAISEVRAEFTKRGGEIGSTGSVLYLFDRLGTIEVGMELQELSLDAIEEAIIDSGALDFYQQDGLFLVQTEPTSLASVETYLVGKKVKISDSNIVYKPKTGVSIESDLDRGKVLDLAFALEGLDDVLTVYHNLELKKGEF